MPRPTNQLELIEDFGIPRLSGPNGQKFIGCVFAAINDMLVEGAATAIRAALLYDVNPRTPDEGGEQPFTAIELLGQEAMLPLYPGEAHSSLVTQLRRKWDHYSGGIKDALLSELERAGYEAIISVPPELDLFPSFVTTRTSAGTSTFTALWPSSVQRGQLGLLVIETANQDISLAVPGWRPLATVGIGAAGGVSATKLTLLARIAESDAEPGAIVTVSGIDHAIAVLATFEGNDLDLDLLTVSIANSTDADTTSISIDAAASEFSQTLQVLITTNQIDGGGGNNVSAQANAELTDITEHVDTNSGLGNGGGITITSGKCEAANVLSTWTATQTASRWAAAVVSIVPRQHWSRFWVGVTDSPITGPGLSWGAHRVGQDRLGPADMPVGYLDTLKTIIARNKPSRWINWEIAFPLDSGTVHILSPFVDDPTHVYFA